MARERQVVRGIVLRSTDTKEADKILTVLTGELGKITVIAKGARSRRSRCTAATELLSCAEMTLSESRGCQYLTEASPLTHFRGLRQDVVLLSLGSYLAQLTDAVTYEALPAEDILRHLLNALYALSELGRPQTLVKAAFELRLMALAGLAPLLDACAVCGREEPEEPVLDVRFGVLRCRSCKGAEGGLAAPLPPAALAAARYVLSCQAQRLYAFQLEKEALRRLGEAAETYVTAQLERSFSTLRFYKDLAGRLPPEA